VMEHGHVVEYGSRAALADHVGSRYAALLSLSSDPERLAS